MLAQLANLSIFDNLTIDNVQISGPQVVALACKMVGGGGSDGSLDLCARVCLIDEYESIISRTYVKPPTPATNYRYIWIRLHKASPDFKPYIYLPATNKTVVHIFWMSYGFSMVKSGSVSLSLSLSLTHTYI